MASADGARFIYLNDDQRCFQRPIRLELEPALVKAYARRYRRSASDGYHVARALTFFEDAERDDPRVVGLSRLRWEEMKRFFEEHASRLVLR